MMEVTILRLDHRTIRDQRITSHVALSARAFGAKLIYYTGERDINLEASIKDVASRWGGNFTIEYLQNLTSFLKSWEGIIVHLTMYGEPHYKTIETLNNFTDKPLLLIIGGSKVPRYIYDLSDFNTAVGWQPHSEIAALSCFLRELNGSEILYKNYTNASIKIIPGNKKSRRSKKFQDLE